MAGYRGESNPIEQQVVGDFGPSGPNHITGHVPDPGPFKGTFRYLCEDGKWKVPPGAFAGYDPTGGGSNVDDAGGMGAPGAQGPPGNPGAAGPAGPMGIGGTDGVDGEDAIALPGPPGIAGPAGSVGPVGSPGQRGEDGEDGVPGAPGPVGPVGGVGLQGPQGLSGIDGNDGDDGPLGAPGPVGPQGAQGTQGVQGVQGLSGIDGNDGDDGLPGVQGIQGNPGATGPAGFGQPGIDGHDGDDGAPGAPGPGGQTGAQGAQGLSGVDGADGEDGLSMPGVPGPQGNPGATGNDGARGANGMDGTDGDDGGPGVPGSIGPQGATGPAGTGMRGMDGIDADDPPFMPGTPGPPGAPGAPGIQGFNGLDGTDGDDALPGVQGIQGNPGATGPAGTGMRGTDGIDGEDGLPGVQGIQGNPGATGPAGFGQPGLDGHDGDDPLALPGPVGPTGAQGTGMRGMDGVDGEDGWIPGPQGVPGPSYRFNVLDYGAIGDGAHDDTTGCQAAINAAVAAGGGNVYFPGRYKAVLGKYRVSGLTITNGSQIVLSGDGVASIIVGTVAGTTVVSFVGPPGLTFNNGVCDLLIGMASGITQTGTAFLLSFYQQGSILISNVSLQGVDGTARNGLNLNSVNTSNFVTNLISEVGAGYGVQINATGSVQSVDIHFTNVAAIGTTAGLVLDGCGGFYGTSVTAGGNYGFYMTKTGSYPNQFSFFTDCIADTCLHHNWYIDTAQTARFDHCWGSSQSSTVTDVLACGFFITANAYDLIFTGCVALNNNLHGYMNFGGVSVTFNGCTGSNNSKSGAGAVGFWSGNGATNVTVNNCRAWDTTLVKLQAYGLTLDGTGDYYIVTGNDFTRNLTGAINNSLVSVNLVMSNNLPLNAWTAFTPTVGAFAGTFTSTSATGRYQRFENTVHFSMVITITNPGTASVAAVVSLPVTAKAAHFAASGREDTSVGINLSVWALSTTTIGIQKYDMTFAPGAGWVMAISGTYEAA